jgi:hypothetical protein
MSFKIQLSSASFPFSWSSGGANLSEKIPRPSFEFDEEPSSLIDSDF